jgi:hypothetical protein
MNIDVLVRAYSDCSDCSAYSDCSDCSVYSDCSVLIVRAYSAYAYPTFLVLTEI